MTTLATPISFLECGCGYEGSLRIRLEATDETLDCSYIGVGDEEIKQLYPIGVQSELPLRLLFGSAKLTTIRQRSLRPKFIGRVDGFVEIDEDSHVILDFGIKIPVDMELSPELDARIGDWLECRGEISVGSG